MNMNNFIPHQLFNYSIIQLFSIRFICNTLQNMREIYHIFDKFLNLRETL